MDITPRGFPHSDICGSTRICRSPQLFAACHVLHRLPVPRHSPCALVRLTFELCRQLFYCSHDKIVITLKVFARITLPHFLSVALLRLQSSLFSFQSANRAAAFRNGSNITCRNRAISRFNRSPEVVGLDGLEPSTSRLSGVRSNHLSYKPISVGVPGGDGRVRTGDLLRARQALSQLSYTPVSTHTPTKLRLFRPLQIKQRDTNKRLT